MLLWILYQNLKKNKGWHMLDETIEKYHLNKDQAEIVKNIINYKNNLIV